MLRDDLNPLIARTMKTVFVFFAMLGMCHVSGCRFTPDPSHPDVPPTCGLSASQPDPIRPDPGHADETPSFRLSASKRDFLTSDKPIDVTFYTEAIDKNATVVLVDSENKVVAKLEDDGRRDTSGDELRGDGVFTAKVRINPASVGEHIFRAVARIGGKDVISRELSIYIVEPFTEQQLADMEAADAALDALVDRAGFLEMHVERRAEMILRTLGELAEQGLVQRDSIEYDEGRAVFFRYSNGIIGGWFLREPCGGERDCP